MSLHWARALLIGSIVLVTASARTAPIDDTSRAERRWTAQADAVFRRLTSTDMRYASAIAQDAEGFIWLATQGGLVRWDGYRTRVYRADPQDAAALPDNYILSLHCDPLGRLWVGTAVGGLARYDPQRDTFVMVGAGPNGLRSASVSAIEAAGSTGLWIGTSEGLDYLDMATQAVARVAVAGDQNGAVKAVLQDGDGTLWVGTEKGLLRRSPGSAQFLSVRLTGAESAGPPIEALLRDSRGNLWIGTRSHGAYVIESGDSTVRPVHETAARSGIESAIISSFVEARPGEIWIGAAGSGVIAVDTAAADATAADAAHWPTRQLRSQGTIPTSLQDDDVHAMYRDRSGLIWVATTMAMNVHDPRQTGISTLFGVTNGDRPITAIQVPFVLVTADDRVWLSAGDGGGIDILDPLAGRVAALRPDTDHPRNRLPTGRVLSMASDPGGDVYIGTRQGLYRAEARGQHLARVDIPQRAADAAVWSLCVDDGVLWVGGTDGLWALGLQRGRARPAPPRVLRHETAGRLGNQRVTAILRGAGNSLWVGTASGLNRLDVASDAVEMLRADRTDPAALLGGYVASLLIDTRGRLWVATVGSGIQVLEGRDGHGRARFRRLGVHEGLPHTGIDKLLQDRHGSIWASTDHGLAVIDPSTFAVRTLGESQGVPIMEYWSNSGARTAAGELLFGGQGGLTVVRPERTAVAHYPAPVVVTEVHAGGTPDIATRFNGAGMPPRLDVAAADHSLMIEFSALDYAAPEENRYHYRLLGFDHDWVDSQATRRLATYTNLPPGDYTLQLSGSSHDSPWTPVIREMPIRVLPAWYQTAWFRLAAAGLALLALAALLQLRTALLRQRQRELQGLVAQRTRELEQRSAELQQRSAELQLRGVELRESQRQLERIAYLDPLTGISNRRLFDTEMAHLTSLALRGGVNFTLLLIDLDRFKHINDTLGHDAGDALLIEVTRRICGVLRASDRVFRLGGDEFAALLVEAGDAAGTAAVCQRLLEDLAMPFDYRDQTLRPGASIGAARWSADAPGPDALYKHADLALYGAKNAGRNTWRWYEPPTRNAATLAST